MKTHPMEIKKFANLCLWTDIQPYEVIRTISPICVEVRAMNTTQIEHPKEVHVGGFSAHVSDNRSGQKYSYQSDETQPIIRLRFSRSKGVWRSNSGNKFVMNDSPVKFHDYNF